MVSCVAVLMECKQATDYLHTQINDNNDEVVDKVKTKTEKFWEMLHKLPSSWYSSLLPYQLPQVQEIFRQILPNALHVVDATAHIGVDTLNIAAMYPLAHITAIDNDEKAVECLQKNIAMFSDPFRFSVVCEDAVSYIKRARPAAELYYFDPPWGGPNYHEKKKLFLELGGENIVNIINFVLENKLTNKVVLKVPKNFAYSEFKEDVKGLTNMFYVKKLQKNGKIAYCLIYIQRRNEW